MFVKVNIEKANNHLCLRQSWAQEDNLGNLFPLRLYFCMFPQSLVVDGLPKCGVLEYSRTVMSAYGGAKLTQGSHSHEKFLNFRGSP